MQVSWGRLGKSVTKCPPKKSCIFGERSWQRSPLEMVTSQQHLTRSFWASSEREKRGVCASIEFASPAGRHSPGPGWRPLTASVLPRPQSRQANPGLPTHCGPERLPGNARPPACGAGPGDSPQGAAPSSVPWGPQPPPPGRSPSVQDVRRPSAGTTAPRKRRPPPSDRRTRPRTAPRGSEARAQLTEARRGRGFPRPVSFGLIWRALMAAVSSRLSAPLLVASLGGAEKARS